MNNQQRYWKKLNILICLMLMVCSLYYEPVVMPGNLDSLPASLLITRVCAFKAVEAEPEVSAHKYEQIVTNSIRVTAGRRFFNKCRFDNKGRISGTSSASRVFFSAVESLRFADGADKQFQGMLSYIWSQIGS